MNRNISSKLLWRYVYQLKTELSISVIIHTIAEVRVHAINLYLYSGLGENIDEQLKTIKGCLGKVYRSVKLVYGHFFAYLFV